MAKPTVQPTAPHKHSALSLAFIGEERNYLIDNLALLLSSGMDIIAALNSIKVELRSVALKKIIDEIIDYINAGFSLGQALEKTSLFPRHIISLITIGEQSGRLHESLSVIVEQQEKTRDFKSKIRAAMMYPVFVLGVAGFVGIGIAWFILPRLSGVFRQLNLQLPLITRLLMGLGNFLADNGSWVVPTFMAVSSILFYFIFIFSKTKWIGQQLLFIIPGVKNLIKQVELARFGYIMGTLLKGGLPIVESLASLSEASPLFAYQKLYLYLKEKIEEGQTFEQSFAQYKRTNRYIPTPVQGLIIAGEQSGRMATIFLKIGQNYEAKTEITTKNLSVVLEPILLVVVWLGVVGVALAVILPIYSLVGGINKEEAGNPPPARSAAPAAAALKTPPLPSTAAPTVVATTTAGFPIKITVTASPSMRVRKNPSASAAVIGTILGPTSTVAYNKKDNWYAIRLPTGQEGWLNGDFVRPLTP